MPLHRRLLFLIFGMRRRQSGCFEIDGVASDGVDALGVDGLAIRIRQFKVGPKVGFFKGGGDLAGPTGSVVGAATTGK